MKHWYRRFRQDVRVFRALFPWRVGLAILVGTAATALIFQRAYLHAYGSTAGSFSYIKAIYAVLNMAAFQVSFADMPPGPILDPFFVIVPLVGIPLILVLSANLLHVLRVFLVRRERGQIWQRALASTIKQPIVILGLGHIGYRVASELLDLHHPVIGLDTTDSSLIQALTERDMPVILGDARDKETLELAGVARASTVVVCTYDDLANIEAAFHVRELNQEARVVLRLFEDDLFGDVSDQFQVEAVLSRSAIAAQAISYAALGVEALETFSLDGQTYVLAEMPITSSSTWLGRPLRQFADARLLTNVCLYRADTLYPEPDPETEMVAGDSLFLFTRLEQLALLTQLSAPQPSACPVLVCGLGHTGYRVIKTLHELGRSVVGVDFEPNRLSERLIEHQIPVVYGDFRQLSVLTQAGISDAEALVVCADDDMLNFEAGLRAREVAPSTRVVMRIFEEPLGEYIEQSFGIDAVYSTSALAAPAFVAAALGMPPTQQVVLGDQVYQMVRLTVSVSEEPGAKTVGALNDKPDVTVLLHRRGDTVQISPHSNQQLEMGDEIVILTTRENLQDLTLAKPTTRKGDR